MPLAVQNVDSDDDSLSGSCDDEPQQSVAAPAAPVAPVAAAATAAPRAAARRKPAARVPEDSVTELVPTLADDASQPGPALALQFGSNLVYRSTQLEESDAQYVKSFTVNPNFATRPHQRDVKSILRGWLDELFAELKAQHQRLVVKAPNKASMQQHQLDLIEQNLLSRHCNKARALVAAAASCGKGGMMALIVLVFAFEMDRFNGLVQGYSPRLLRNICTNHRIVMHAARIEWVTEMTKEFLMRSKPKTETGETTEQFEKARDSFFAENWLVRIAGLPPAMAKQLRDLVYVFNIEGYGDGSVQSCRVAFNADKFKRCYVFVCTDQTLHVLLLEGLIGPRDAAIRMRDEDESAAEGKQAKTIASHLPFTLGVAFTGTPSGEQEKRWHRLHTVTLGDLLDSGICPKISILAVYSDGMTIPGGHVITRQQWDSSSLSTETRDMCESLYSKEMQDKTVLTGLRTWFIKMDEAKVPLQMIVHCPSTPHLKELDNLKALCSKMVQEYAVRLVSEGRPDALALDPKKQFALGHEFAQKISRWAHKDAADYMKIFELKNQVIARRRIYNSKKDERSQRSAKFSLDAALARLDAYKYAWEEKLGPNQMAEYPFVDKSNEEQVKEVNTRLRRIVDAYHQRKPPAEIIGDEINTLIATHESLEPWLGPASVWDEDLQEFKEAPRVHPILGRRPCVGVMHGSCSAESMASKAREMQRPGQPVEKATAALKKQLSRVAHRLRTNSIDVLVGSDAISRALDSPSISVSVMLTKFSMEKESEGRSTMQKIARSLRHMYVSDPRLVRVARGHAAKAIQKYDERLKGSPLEECKREAMRRLRVWCDPKNQSVTIVENAMNRNHTIGGSMSKLFEKHGAASAFKPMPVTVDNIDRVTANMQLDMSKFAEIEDFEESEDEADCPPENEDEGSEESDSDDDADDENPEPEEEEEKPDGEDEIRARLAAEEARRKKREAIQEYAMEQSLLIERQTVHVRQLGFANRVRQIEPFCDFETDDKGAVVLKMLVPDMAKLIRQAVEDKIEIQDVIVEQQREGSWTTTHAVPRRAFQDAEVDDLVYQSEMVDFAGTRYVTFKVTYTPVQDLGIGMPAQSGEQVCETFCPDWICEYTKERLMQEAEVKRATYLERQSEENTARALASLRNQPGVTQGQQIDREGLVDGDHMVVDAQPVQQSEDEEEEETAPLSERRPKTRKRDHVEVGPEEEEPLEQGSRRSKRLSASGPSNRWREDSSDEDDSSDDEPVQPVQRTQKEIERQKMLGEASKAKPVREVVQDYANLTQNQKAAGVDAITLTEQTLVKRSSGPMKGYTSLVLTEVASTKRADGADKKPLEHESLQELNAAAAEAAKNSVSDSSAVAASAHVSEREVRQLMLAVMIEKAPREGADGTVPPLDECPEMWQLFWWAREKFPDMIDKHAALRCTANGGCGTGFVMRDMRLSGIVARAWHERARSVPPAGQPGPCADGRRHDAQVFYLTKDAPHTADF